MYISFLGCYLEYIDENFTEIETTFYGHTDQ